MPNAAIIGTGHYLPERIVTNDDLTRLMDTSDAWIRERTGIAERRWVEPGTSGADLALAATRMALADAAIDAAEIDLLVYATLNPDYAFPGNGVLLQRALGVGTIGAMDIRNQCTGFIYGLAAAHGFIAAGTARTVLVVGAEIHSTGLDISTRGRDLAVLFGDGAGAVLVRATDEDRGVLASVLHSQGEFARELWCELPTALEPGRWTAAMAAQGRQFPFMNGRAVFQHAIRRFVEAIDEVLARAGVTRDDVALFVPHQANQRITEMVTRRLEVAPERVWSNIERYGNTTAASIPIALSEAVRAGRVRRGDLVLLVGFGSGFTWGANLIRW
ncbi:MAG: 3-oxoacyl-ACP synthase III family protein [Candidatus Krumholzibacteriia bacterium]